MLETAAAAVDHVVKMRLVASSVALAAAAVVVADQSLLLETEEALRPLEHLACFLPGLSPS